jgi:hypothetical protein
MALGVVIAVPWGDANRRHPLSISLKDQDGQAVEAEMPDGQQQLIQQDSQFEIGRPPGIKPGSDLNAVLVFRYAGLQLAPGGYLWELTVGDAIENVPFWVVGGNA